MVGAGLFVRTFARLATIDLGFDRDPLLIVNLELQRGGVAAEDRLRIAQRFEEAARTVPGVARAALSNLTPVSGMGWNDGIEVEGGRRYSEREMVVWFNGIGPGYFSTYGTALLVGRDFATTDTKGTPRVAIVNRAFADKYIGSEIADALGRTVKLSGPVPATPHPRSASSASPRARRIKGLATARLRPFTCRCRRPRPMPGRTSVSPCVRPPVGPRCS